MATYDNKYSIKVNPATPNLRGLTTNYDNTGQTNLGGIGLGDLYELDYDRDAIEKVFNQGTDAQYALMQKENQIAQNQYANNQFANQQSAIESLRQQRNEQIASGMARGLNAAQEQGTILGLQQEGAAGALELANKQQLAADEIAVAYAENVAKALEEANAVKQAMAGISAQLYEADMLGYTGELSAAAQMDANASNRYGSELGYEGSIYTADRNYDAAKYSADRNYDAAVLAAEAQIQAAQISAGAQTAAARLSRTSGAGVQETQDLLDEAIARVSAGTYRDGNDFVSQVTNYLRAKSSDYNNQDYGELWATVDQYVVNRTKDIKNQTWADWNKKQQAQTTKTQSNTKSLSTNEKAVNYQVNNATGNTLQDAFRLYSTM